jgi:hypothetical protein
MVGTLVEDFLTDREPVLIPEASRDPRTRRTTELAPGVGALMVAPLAGDRACTAHSPWQNSGAGGRGGPQVTAADVVPSIMKGRREAGR